MARRARRRQLLRMARATTRRRILRRLMTRVLRSCYPPMEINSFYHTALPLPPLVIGETPPYTEVWHAIWGREQP